MTGRTTLAEIRGELEAVMDRIPPEAGAVTQALMGSRRSACDLTEVWSQSSIVTQNQERTIC